MTTWKILLVLLGLATSALELAGQTEAAAVGWLHGAWTGTGDQRSSGRGTWPMKLTYDSAKKTAAVDYPSLSCGGSWKLVEGNAVKAVFKENLSTGKQACPNGLSVVVTKVNAATVKIAYFNPGDNVNDASKTLTTLMLTKP